MTTPLIFTRQGIRDLDRHAIDQLGIPGVILMEHAAAALADHAHQLLLPAAEEHHREPRHVLILVGPGNNGGDGLALARLLHSRARITLALAASASRFQGDARAHLHVAGQLAIPTMDASAPPQAGLDRLLAADPPHLIVDCLFGTGLTRPITAPAASLVVFANHQRSMGVPILAADIPSGLDADTGEPLGEHTIRATRTVTFVGLKVGLTKPQSAPYVGDIHTAPIGLPHHICAEFARKS